MFFRPANATSWFTAGAGNVSDNPTEHYLATNKLQTQKNQQIIVAHVGPDLKRVLALNSSAGEKHGRGGTHEKAEHTFVIV